MGTSSVQVLRFPALKMKYTYTNLLSQWLTFFGLHIYNNGKSILLFHGPLLSLGWVSQCLAWHTGMPPSTDLVVAELFQHSCHNLLRLGLARGRGGIRGGEMCFGTCKLPGSRSTCSSSMSRSQMQPLYFTRPPRCYTVDARNPAPAARCKRNVYLCLSNAQL